MHTGHTSGEVWSLYRAIVTLFLQGRRAAENSPITAPGSSEEGETMTHNRKDFAAGIAAGIITFIVVPILVVLCLCSYAHSQMSSCKGRTAQEQCACLGKIYNAKLRGCVVKSAQSQFCLTHEPPEWTCQAVWRSTDGPALERNALPETSCTEAQRSMIRLSKPGVTAWMDLFS